MSKVTITTKKDIAEKIGGMSANGGGSISMSLEDYAKYSAAKKEIEQSAIALPSQSGQTQPAAFGQTNPAAFGSAIAVPPGRIKTTESIAGAVDRKYGKRIAAALEALTSRKPFGYDPGNDPVFAAYKSTYEREGESAFRRVLNDNNTSVTGASGAVLSEAIAARNSELKKLTDIIPELAGEAYKRYMGEGERLSDELKTIAGLAADEYDREYKANRDAYSDLVKTLSAERSERHWNAEQEQQRIQNERNAESDVYKNALARIETEMAGVKLRYYPAMLESDILAGSYKAESDALDNAAARGFYTGADEAALPWLAEYRTSGGYSISPMLTEAAYAYQREYNKKRAGIAAVMGW